MPKKTFTRSARPPMSAEEATTFKGMSPVNMAIVSGALEARKAAGLYPECRCDAYKDIFTYERWKAQGAQVRRGEKKLCSVQTIITRTTDGQERQIPWWSALFCRCQVGAAVTTAADPQPDPIGATVSIGSVMVMGDNGPDDKPSAVQAEDELEILKMRRASIELELAEALTGVPLGMGENIPALEW